MKCENCRAYNAHVIIVGNKDERYILCPRCLKILEQLNSEYHDIVSTYELTSTGHIDKK